MRSSPCCCSTWRGFEEEPETPPRRRPWPWLKSQDKHQRTALSSRGRTEPEKLSSCSPEAIPIIKDRHKVQQRETGTCLLIGGLDHCPGLKWGLKLIIYVLGFFWKRMTYIKLPVLLPFLKKCNASTLLVLVRFLTWLCCCWVVISHQNHFVKFYLTCSFFITS